MMLTGSGKRRGATKCSGQVLAGAEQLRETKIDKNDMTRAVEEDVFGLEVPMFSDGTMATFFRKCREGQAPRKLSETYR
jgi:hypothetical protein